MIISQNAKNQPTSFSAGEIEWPSRALLRREHEEPWNLDGLGHGELLSFTFELQNDLRGLRELLSVALAAVARLTAQCDRLRADNRRLADELRGCRAEAA